jgi:hypothetical protein
MHAISWGFELAVTEYLVNEGHSLSDARRSTLLPTAVMYLNSEPRDDAAVNGHNTLMNCI